MKTKRLFPISTFNGLTETSIRLLIILETNFGKGFDFKTLRLMDFFAVYSGDIDGPRSLHPLSSGRGRAYVTRKSLITDALQFLQLAKLIDETNGIYSARNPDDGDAYRTPYLAGLQLVSSWMKERSNQIGYRRFADEMREAVMKLAEEYLSSRPPRENTDVHNWLKTSYESDILRLEGLQDACDVFECLLDVEFKSASNDNGAIIPPLGYFKDVHAAATKEIISTLSSYTDLLQIS